MRAFAVDDVTAVVSEIPRAAYDLAQLLGGAVIAKSPELEHVIAPPRLAQFNRMNGFALAVHRAFSEHRPLTLSPDALWLAILQGFALHVREHEPELRQRFVAHQGKKTLKVVTGQVPHWPHVVNDFVAALSSGVNPGLIRALTDRFSTTSETEHTAHGIAVMDSFSQFFDYTCYSICGIPTVTLLGTPDDWRAMRERFRVLSEYGLQWWAAQLDPVLAQFVRSSEGDADVEFWKSIYKPQKAYGHDTVTGWLVRFFPYLEFNEGTLRRNAMTVEGTWVHEPITPSHFPQGLSKATVRVDDDRLLTLCSGFFGVRQERDTSLAPHIGWVVLDKPTAALWDDFARAHQLPPPCPDRQLEHVDHVPALLFEFYARFDGGPIYDGALTLTRAPRDLASLRDYRHGLYVPLTVTETGIQVLSRFAMRLGVLRDGSELLWAREYTGRRQFVERVFVRKPDAPGPWDVVADSLLELYQRFASVRSFPPWEVKGTWMPLRDQ